jgi:bacterial microcompartment shell vertex protein
MQIARIIGTVVSTSKNSAYAGKSLFLITPLRPDGSPKGRTTIAVDIGLDVGIGDLVLVSGAPGLAPSLLKLPFCPMRDLIVGIIDTVDTSVSGHLSMCEYT